MTNNKISALIPATIPEYVREEYPTFVKFLEAYYEYLEVQKNPQDVLSNLRQYTDIDETLDEFVDYFQRQYLHSLPRGIAADRRLLAKHIQELYRIKGTEKSFSLLFRILFNEDVELYYPKVNILKASSGKWVQDVSLHVKTVSGNIEDIVGNAFTVVNETGSVTTLALDLKPLDEDGTLHELFISNNYKGTFKVGDEIRYGSFVGVIQPVVVSLRIEKGGKGFKLGQIYSVSNGGGHGTLVKVTRVTPDGGVTGLSLLTFGQGYVSDFYTQLVATQNVSALASPYDQFTNGYIESGYITKSDYFGEDYSTPDFSAEVLGQFGGNIFVPENSSFNDDDSCIVLMRLGAVAKYPGYYKTTDGFLSDVNALQDSFYYQDFSYVIKSTRKLDEYKKFVKDILHPAGMKLFGEYQIVNEMDLGDFLEYDKVVLKLLEQDDFVDAVDTIAKIVGKGLDDTSTTGDDVAKTVGKAADDISTASDVVVMGIGKGLTDSTFQSDGLRFDMTKVLADLVANAETIAIGIGKLFADITSNTDSLTIDTGKGLTDSTGTTTDSTVFTTGKGLTDSTGTTTDSTAIDVGKPLSETFSSVDAAAIGTTKPIAETTANVDSIVLNIGKSLSESSSMADSGNITLSDYSVDAFVPDYSGTSIRTF